MKKLDREIQELCSLATKLGNEADKVRVLREVLIPVADLQRLRELAQNVAKEDTAQRPQPLGLAISLLIHSAGNQ